MCILLIWKFSDIIYIVHVLIKTSNPPLSVKLHVLLMIWCLKYLSYYFKTKLPNSSFLISLFLLLILSITLHNQYAFIETLNIANSVCDTICTKNCSFRSYYCVQFSDSFGVKTIFDPPGKYLSLCPGVVHVYDGQQHFGLLGIVRWCTYHCYGEDATCYQPMDFFP